MASANGPNKLFRPLYVRLRSLVGAKTSRCAGQRQRHSRNYYGDAPVRLSAARCLATVTAVPTSRAQPTSSLSCPARPHSSTTAGRRRNVAASNSTKIRSPSPQQQQQQEQQQRSKTPAIAASRRALRVYSSSLSQCLQRQRRQEQYKTNAGSTGEGGKVDDGGGVQQGEGDRSSRDGERFEEEEEEGVVASMVEKVCVCVRGGEQIGFGKGWDVWSAHVFVLFGCTQAPGA